MYHSKKYFILLLLFFFILIQIKPKEASASCLSETKTILLLKNTTVNIGDEFYLYDLPLLNGLPTYKSSKPSVASVDSFGLVTAKKSGTAKITVKLQSLTLSYSITVKPTEITLNKTSVSLEHNEKIKLSAATSNGAFVTYKSSKKSVAMVDANGTITALKPGVTIITAMADGSKATCKVTVVKPTVKLSHSSITLYRGQSLTLSADVSSKLPPSWKTNKKSVATVDANGTITAQKHGTAIITASIDGVAKSCTVTVKQPVITLNTYELSLPTGATYQLTAKVTSNNTPVFTSSNQSKLTVSTNGLITAVSKGTAYVTVSEDGVKVKCKVIIS